MRNSLQRDPSEPRHDFAPVASSQASEIHPSVLGTKHPSHAPAARRGRFPVGPVVAVAVLASLAGWVGLRAKTELRNRDTVAQTRDQVAKAAVEAASKPPPVGTVRGVAEQWQARVPVDGTLTPVREADLGFKTGGRIAAIRVKVGDRVAAGALLASLESSEAQAQLVAAEAQVRAAEAQLALAADSHRRTAAMVQTGGMPEATGVQLDHQRALAAAQLDGAKAQAGLARVNLQNHALTAPFSGIVTRVPAGPGAVVGAGIPQFHVSDLSTLKLVGTVGEGAASLVRVGAEVEIQVDGATAVGTVASVLASVDPATRRVPVEAEVSSATTTLRAGSFVRAQIRGGQSVPVLRYPHGVLRPGSQDEVMIVNNGVLESRRVLFVLAPEGSLLVRSGLSPDESVLLAPTAEAKDGDRVQVTP